jgi:hypothetical protein
MATAVLWDVAILDLYESKIVTYALWSTISVNCWSPRRYHLHLRMACIAHSTAASSNSTMAYRDSDWLTVTRPPGWLFHAKDQNELGIAVQMKGFFVLNSGRREPLAAVTSVKNPASCSTNPMKERSSVMLMGRGNCEMALNLSGSIRIPPFWISYPTHLIFGCAKLNFSGLKITLGFFGD